VKKYVNGKYIEMTGEEIEQIWANEGVSYNEAVNAKIRQRYSESQELAILRQRDEKPDEFREYFEYCEQCKALVKEDL